ncbi:MAG: HAD family phosphatase, partial [Candidatus Nanohaloarchaea archaeon]|nr:HAD family phosphatase [Candidatus Nanohaloarchaea archaeon]
DSMLQAVIFDMDGVIIDSEALHKETEIQALHEAGVDITEDDLVKYTGMPLITILRSLKEDRQEEFDPETVAERKTEKYLDRINELQPIDGAVQTVRTISQDYRTALASSSRRALVDAVVDMLDLENSFQTTLSFNDVENGKPDPEIFEQAAASLETTPSETAVIEDSRNGVIAANRGGFHTIGFQSSDDIDLSPADYVTDTMDRIPPLLETIEQKD